MPGLLQQLLERFSSAPPDEEAAVDRAVAGMRRQVTEARLQVAVARGAERRQGLGEPSPGLQRLEEFLASLESRVDGAAARRDALVAALQRARAETTVQHALLEAHHMDEGLAFDALEAAVRDAEALGAATQMVHGGPERQR